MSEEDIDLDDWIEEMDGNEDMFEVDVDDLSTIEFPDIESWSWIQVKTETLEKLQKYAPDEPRWGYDYDGAIQELLRIAEFVEEHEEELKELAEKDLLKKLESLLRSDEDDEE